jgi:hypothetical protein
LEEEKGGISVDPTTGPGSVIWRGSNPTTGSGPGPTFECDVVRSAQSFAIISQHVTSDAQNVLIMGGSLMATFCCLASLEILEILVKISTFDAKVNDAHCPMASWERERTVSRLLRAKVMQTSITMLPTVDVLDVV